MLFDWLCNQSSVYGAFPRKPEPKYFLENSVTLGEYRSRYFRSIPPETKWLVEKSTSYYEHPEVADRIAQLIPDSRIVAILRNPVDRAISNYWFSVKHGLESRTIEEVFLRELEKPQLRTEVSVDPFNYIQRGFYANMLTPFLRRFLDRMDVLIFERFIRDAEYRSDFQQRLGLNLSANPDPEWINHSDPEQPTPPEVLQMLRTTFENSISQLEATFKLELSEWKTNA